MRKEEKRKGVREKEKSEKEIKGGKERRWRTGENTEGVKEEKEVKKGKIKSLFFLFFFI